MHPETCPCCFEENVYKIDWPYVPPGETPLEPAEGFCSACGFHWSEHCQHPESEQILNHRLRCIEQMCHYERALKWLSKTLHKYIRTKKDNSLFWYQQALKNTETGKPSKKRRRNEPTNFTIFSAISPQG